TVRAKPVDIAGGHHHLRFIFGFQLGGVGIAMTSVDPAVESPSELSRHAVSVPVADGAQEDLAAAGLIFVVGIITAINVGNAVSDGPVAERKNADGNVEIPSEGGDLVRPAIVTVDLQDSDDIAARVALGSKWVL